MGPQLEPKVLGLTRSEQRSKGKPELPTQDPGAKHACRELEVDSGSKLEVFPINEQMLVTADISASWKLPSEPGCAPTCRPVPEQVATLAKPTRCPGVELDGKNIIRHGSKGKAESRMLQLGFQTDHKPGLHVNELCENLCHEDCKSNTQVRPTSQELVLRHMGGAVQGPSNMDEATNKTTVAMLRHQNPSQPHWITIANQHLQPGLQHPGVPQQEVADMLRPQNSSDLWVAVKGRPSVVPGQPSQEPEADSCLPAGGGRPMLESEEGSHAQDSSFEEDTYVTVQHEDVVDAVADFVKGRIHSHVMCSNFKPKDIAAAVDTAFADEKGSGWERVWGKGRLLFRSAEAIGRGSQGIAAELGPEGRTGRVLRCASSKAMSVISHVADKVTERTGS